MILLIQELMDIKLSLISTAFIHHVIYQQFKQIKRAKSKSLNGKEHKFEMVILNAMDFTL